MTTMTYVQIGQELTRRIWAIKPRTQFQLVRDFNDKKAIKESLQFPENTSEEEKTRILQVIDDFEGHFKQENQ